MKDFVFVWWERKRNNNRLKTISIMKPYSHSNQGENESYNEYKTRKCSGWENRINAIFIEIKDSSLKPMDKSKITKQLKEKLSK